jgi:hypothetical protein
MTMRKKIAALLVITQLVMLFLASSAWAHAMPSSAVSLDFYEDHVMAELILPLDRLEIAFKHTLTDSPADVLNKYQEELKSYIKMHVHPVTGDGRDWNLTVSGMSLQLEKEPYDLIVSMVMEPPQGASVEAFTFNYDVIIHEIVTHSVLVSVRSDWNNAVFASKPELIGTLRADKTSIDVDRTNGSWWLGFKDVVGLGMQHIAEGTDHLLFLLTLLLPAPLIARNKRWAKFGGIRRSIRQLLKVITAFTIGHSITLITGSLGWVHAPSQLIEILIAISILVSAIHALRPLFPGREAFVAMGFGLVHGMAFATLIEEIGISPWRMAASILGFNIGIELMQVAVIAVTVPWLIILSLTKAFPAVRNAGACLAMVASLGWMMERITMKSNSVSSLVDAATGREYWIIVLLAAISLVAFVWHNISYKHPRTP